MSRKDVVFLKLRAISAGLALLALLGQAAWADSSQWDQVVQKIRGAHDYHFRYGYEGTEGRYRFLYTAIPQAVKIKTEILEGSDRGTGTVILYDSARSADTVTVRTPLLTLRRSIESKDISGSSLYIPLLDQILEKVTRSRLIASKSATVEGVKLLQLQFESGATRHYAYIHPQDKDIRLYQQFQGQDKVEELRFSDIVWNSYPDLEL